MARLTSASAAAWPFHGQEQKNRELPRVDVHLAVISYCVRFLFVSNASSSAEVRSFGEAEMRDEVGIFNPRSIALTCV
jgi:hypothetical protein